mmetsp:Transcript_62243/g.140772  ORF Transcript_62243/g.140772 Transcript_62243/m.140772 type:complete len:222 (+) Transcript_62243:325-990(+)
MGGDVRHGRGEVLFQQPGDRRDAVGPAARVRGRLPEHAGRESPRRDPGGGAQGRQGHPADQSTEGTAAAQAAVREDFGHRDGAVLLQADRDGGHDLGHADWALPDGAPASLENPRREAGAGNDPGAPQAGVGGAPAAHRQAAGRARAAGEGAGGPRGQEGAHARPRGVERGLQERGGDRGAQVAVAEARRRPRRPYAFRPAVREAPAVAQAGGTRAEGAPL